MSHWNLAKAVCGQGKGTARRSVKHSPHNLLCRAECQNTVKLKRLFLVGSMVDGCDSRRLLQGAELWDLVRRLREELAA